MTRVLVVNRQVPWPLDDGNALRVAELARHRTPDIECHLAYLPASLEGLDELRRLGIYDSVTALPAVQQGRSWRRFLRGGDRDYQRITYPDHYRAVTSALEALVREREIEVVVAVLERCEEYVRPLRGIAKLVDQYDCLTLAHERQLGVRNRHELWQRWAWQRRISQARSIEGGLGRRCDIITAIAPPDVERLRQLNPGARVERVPNGISQSLLDRVPHSTSIRRGIAFWGNLSFPVNQQAIASFLESVWRPYLENSGLEFAIVGPHADDAMRRLVAQYRHVELAGFVPDLFAFLDQYPVMINPMVTGGGLKNKVLEAFAARRAVVTSSLGIDAFPEATEAHCHIADQPEDQAAAIVALLDDAELRQGQVERARQLVSKHYTWRTVGATWSALLAELAETAPPR